VESCEGDGRRGETITRSVRSVPLRWRKNCHRRGVFVWLATLFSPRGVKKFAVARASDIPPATASPELQACPSNGAIIISQGAISVRRSYTKSAIYHWGKHGRVNMGCGSVSSRNLVPCFLCTLVYVEPKIFFFFRAEKFLSAAPINE